jgi:glycosidase
MPDLNQSNPLVNYLKQNAIWWIEYADLDGFRVDTYNYSDPTGIASWTKAITDEYPNFKCGRNLDAKPSTNGVLAKDSKIGAIKLQFLPAECYGLYVIRCYWHRFQ